MKFESQCNTFRSWKFIWNIVCATVAIMSRGRWVNLIPVTIYGVTGLWHPSFSWWLAGCSAPSHHLKQCWRIVNCIIGNKNQWNLIQNTFFQGNEMGISWRHTATKVWISIDQVMVFCLTVPSFYINQFWLVARCVLLFWPDSNFTRSTFEFKP